MELNQKLETNQSNLDKKEKIDFFNKLIAENEKKQSLNPFSQNWANIKSNVANKIDKNDPTYGIPTNVKTFKRGIQANAHVSNEITELCQVIRENGIQNEDGCVIQFSRLFNIYNAISNKLVGLLLRARKHGLVNFEGEILFQGRDDNKIITLLNKEKLN